MTRKSFSKSSSTTFSHATLLSMRFFSYLLSSLTAPLSMSMACHPPGWPSSPVAYFAPIPVPAHSLPHAHSHANTLVALLICGKFSFSFSFLFNLMVHAITRTHAHAPCTCTPTHTPCTHTHTHPACTAAHLHTHMPTPCMFACPHAFMSHYF